jgi:hypothetical protein
MKPLCQALVYQQSGNWSSWATCQNGQKHTVSVYRGNGVSGTPSEPFEARICGIHKRALDRGSLTLHNPAEDRSGYGGYLGLQVVRKHPETWEDK